MTRPHVILGISGLWDNTEGTERLWADMEWPVWGKGIWKVMDWKNPWMEDGSDKQVKCQNCRAKQEASKQHTTTKQEHSY